VVSSPARQRRGRWGWTTRRLRHPQFQPTSRRHRAASRRLLAAKLAVTRRERARFATAAFVTGELDPVRSREAWLALFAAGLPPTLVLRPASAPPRSTAEIDALIASGRVHAAEVRGALAAHEEYPDDAAAAILGFVGVPD
jgi:hypothetical protein